MTSESKQQQQQTQNSKQQQHRNHKHHPPVPVPTVLYTLTDEAPALATRSLLPIFHTFCHGVVDIQLVDISLAGRVLAAFGERPDELERLGQLCRTDPTTALIKLPNISASVPQLIACVKELQQKHSSDPNASLGYNPQRIPDFVENPQTEAEKANKAKYMRVLGSAVNPVLREGNSDRRAALPVKTHSKLNKLPVRAKPWHSTSKTHVASMANGGDFFGNEQSVTIGGGGGTNNNGDDNKQNKIEEEVLLDVVLEPTAGGSPIILKQNVAVHTGDIVDASFMSAAKLKEYFEEQFQQAVKEGIAVSLHLKATMMKVSDPIIFGHAVRTFYRSAFDKHAEFLENHAKVNPNDGIAAVLSKIVSAPTSSSSSSSGSPNPKEVLSDFAAVYNQPDRPKVAMVDTQTGVTNFHVPSDVIIDASMPPMIRDGGKMWVNAPSSTASTNGRGGGGGNMGQLADTKCLIPDRSYAAVFQRVIDDCKQHGQFDHASLGHVSNVGLMAKKAEEYGSHDKTFEISTAGTVKVIMRHRCKQTQTDEMLFEHRVEKGDIWRMCVTKDIAIQDWIRLAVKRAHVSQTPAIFWLDEQHRAHDRELVKKVKDVLQHDPHVREQINSMMNNKQNQTKMNQNQQQQQQQHQMTSMISIQSPADACGTSLIRLRAGLDTISVTGNVLRDYITDLFPIIELGTSAKMLSIVPLLKGGSMYETGAGGSAPKHVQQFLSSNHLRWDSLGEYLALGACLEDLARNAATAAESSNSSTKKKLLSKQARMARKLSVLSTTLNAAIERYLRERKGPSRRVKTPDNRLSHFYLAMFWAEELCRGVEEGQEGLLRSKFLPLLRSLCKMEKEVVTSLVECQGVAVSEHVQGYYYLNEPGAVKVMNPCEKLNELFRHYHQNHQASNESETDDDSNNDERVTAGSLRSKL